MLVIGRRPAGEGRVGRYEDQVRVGRSGCECHVDGTVSRHPPVTHVECRVYDDVRCDLMHDRVTLLGVCDVEVKSGGAGDRDHVVPGGRCLHHQLGTEVTGTAGDEQPHCCWAVAKRRCCR